MALPRTPLSYLLLPHPSSVPRPCPQYRHPSPVQNPRFLRGVVLCLHPCGHWMNPPNPPLPTGKQTKLGVIRMRQGMCVHVHRFFLLAVWCVCLSEYTIRNRGSERVDSNFRHSEQCGGCSGCARTQSSRSFSSSDKSSASRCRSLTWFMRPWYRSTLGRGVGPMWGGLGRTRGTMGGRGMSVGEAIDMTRKVEPS